MRPVDAGLIQRIEDEFQISFSDQEMDRTRTVGDLHRLIMSKLAVESSRRFARMLYTVRQSLAEAVGVPRSSIGPATPLQTLLPLDNRAEQWASLARISGLRFPHLQHSRGWKDRIMLASIAIAAMPVMALWWALYALDWIRGMGLVLFFLPAALAFLLLESRVDKHLQEATRNRAAELPCATVGELAQAALELNSPASPPALLGEPPFEEDVWEKMKELIRQSGASGLGTIMPGTLILELQRAN